MASKVEQGLTRSFAKARGHRLHFLGLVSDGGVHSHQNHLIALKGGQGSRRRRHHDPRHHRRARYFAHRSRRLPDHGRRSDQPRRHIATVIGRYYAMDRDQRWDRNKLAWDAIVFGRGAQSHEAPAAAVSGLHARDARRRVPRADHFCNANEQRVRDGDVVIWFNFRADRARQLFHCVPEKGFPASIGRSPRRCILSPSPNTTKPTDARCF